MPKWTALLPVVLLLACHDSPRSNPLDPELTPAAALTAAADDTAGTVTLSWTPYAGETPFGEYRVLRNAVHSTEVETLFTAASPDSIRFVDLTRQPDTAYEYRVAAVNQAGLSRESTTVTVPGYTVAGVRLLTAESDSLAGMVRLTWSRYAGAGYSQYEVLRRQVGLDRTESLIRLSAPGDTVYDDAQALHGLSYLYTVVTRAAGRELTGNSLVATLALPAVTLALPEPASATASARLTWTRYRGPRFVKYQVERLHQAPGAEQAYQSEVVYETADLADTSRLDPGLQGNTLYEYRVVVRTDRNEEVASAGQQGAFHRFVESWPLPLDAAYAVHLARTADGRITVLANEQRVSGRLQAVYELDPVSGSLTEPLPVEGWAQIPVGSSALDLGSEVWVSLAEQAAAGLLRYQADGRPRQTTQQLFAPDDLPVLQGEETTLLGEILFTEDRFMGMDLHSTELYSGPVLARQDSFTRGIPSPWETRGLYNRYYGLELKAGNTSLAYHDPSWRDPGLKATVYAFTWGSMLNNRFTARLGGDTYSRLSLTLDWQLQQAELEWVFTPPPGSGLPARQERVSAPVSLLARVFYTVGLGIRDGRIAATLASPAVLAMPNPSGRYWTCLAALGDGAALTVFDSAYTVGAEGTILGRGKLTAGASELRTWSARRGTGLGVCLGEQRRLLLGTVTPGSEATWTELLTSAVGPGIGSGQGFLAYPVSFDVAPDGRIFVLDAGLRRVVVFGSNRKYLTSWGTEGAGDGEFSLGKGNARGEDGTLDLYGSLLVGSDGAVYVADPGNQRIQRFAP